jgi:phosphoglycolate phosphatase
VQPAARRLVLWDIDGTLTHSGSVATDVFSQAVEQFLGEPPAGPVTFAGMTDRQIAEEFLSRSGRADPIAPEVILDIVEHELARRAAEIVVEGKIYPGAREAIEALSLVPRVAQTVLTGNTPANARLKLAAFGLDALLDLDAGAFGREFSDRCLLLPFAWRRQAELYGRSFRPETTWIIGDTPRDLECARSGGAHCLLVGTGRFPPSELEGLGADEVLADLSDTARVVAVVTGTG